MRTELDGVLAGHAARVFKLRCRGVQHLALALFWFGVAACAFVCAWQLWRLEP